MSREEVLVLEFVVELTLEAALDVALELTELELLLDAELADEADEALDVLVAAEDELALLCAELEVLLELAFVAVVVPAEPEDEESPPPPPPPHAASRLSSRQGSAFFKARDFTCDSSKVSS
jgi:hypothetical protein